MYNIEPFLFKAYPDLKKSVPWVPLLSKKIPPIERLTNLERYFNLKQGKIYIKRDDINNPRYGGNKYRKLEFILGDVLKKKKIGVITVGGTGTNHGLACSIMCNDLILPLKCDLFLFPQPVTDHVRNSILLFKHFKATTHYEKRDLTALIKSIIFKVFHPNYYYIPPSGTPLTRFGTPLGTIGFINAAFELQMQINKEKLPVPDLIFVAGGSTGTGAGLIAGCKLLGLKTKVNIISVFNERMINEKNVIINANKALYYLHKKASLFPKLEVNKDDFILTRGYIGQGYGDITEKCRKAISVTHELEGKKNGFMLDTTYTGKAMAAIFDFMAQENNKAKTILFWNTFNSNDLSIYLKNSNPGDETGKWH